MPDACFSTLEAEIRHPIGPLRLEVMFTTSSAKTVLFGPSGSGKSTVLRCIAGLLHPQHGRIALNGLHLLDTEARLSLPSRSRGIGLAAQRSALFPHLTVRENVAFGLHRLSPSERALRVDEALALFSAEAFATRRPHELSGGERQRVALARAAAPLPRLLLLDEPFAGLELPLRSELIQRLSTWLQAHSVAVLYVTHEVSEVFELEADVLVLERGRVVRHGSAARVLGRERDLLLRQLRATLPLL